MKQLQKGDDNEKNCMVADEIWEAIKEEKESYMKVILRKMLEEV